MRVMRWMTRLYEGEMGEGKEREVTVCRGSFKMRVCVDAPFIQSRPRPVLAFYAH